MRTVIKHVTKRIRGADGWRNANIVWRGDSHYGRVEAMDWCDDNDADYIFGLAGNAALDREVAELSRSSALLACVVERAEDALLRSLHVSGRQLEDGRAA